MLIFLDANVILTGAFTQSGPAALLVSIKSNVRFCHSNYVLDECKKLIKSFSPTNMIYELVNLRVLEFLNALSSKCVPEHPLPIGIFCHDPYDDPLLGAAIACCADAICTYNVKDFPINTIPIKTPLLLLRLFSEPTINQCIQPVILSSKGTLLFCGRIKHVSSMGLILKSDNNISVMSDENGYIRLYGTEVRQYKTFNPLIADEEFKLSIRYNHDYFEAAVWKKTSTSWEKTILTIGVAKFSSKTFPILFFVPNHQFSGHIQCISGLPRFIRDSRLLVALENYSLEATTQSLDVRSFLKNLA